jgi:outer membrane protein
MKMICYFTLLGGLLAVCAVLARADDAPILTRQEARQIAIRNHPKITAAQLIALASKQMVREVRSAYFPTISADATAAGAGAGNTRIAAGGLNNPLILERNAEGLNFSQLITDFGRTANLSASSKLHSQAEDQNALATRAQILLGVDAAYFNALQAQSVLTVAQQTVATRQLTFDRINELAKQQLRSGLDVSFAKVNLQEARLLLANARNDLQTAFANFDNLLGQRDQRIYRLVEEPAPAGQETNVDNLVQVALRERPDLSQLRLERESAARFARAQRDLHYPTVSAFGGAGVLPIHDPALRDNYAAAGVNLSLPIFDGFLFSAKQKEAELRARAVAEDLRDEEDNVIRDVRIAALNLNNAAERLEVTAQLLESANEAYELADARYNAKSISIVDLSQAELNQTEAELARTRARYDYQIQTAVLDYQTGKQR